MDLFWGASAGFERASEVSAGAWIHGGDEHEVGGECVRGVGTAYGNFTVF